MKKKKINRFDLLVDSFITEFANVPNLNLLSSDGNANKAFQVITFRIAEINSYKELVCNHFIPATNQAIVTSQNDLRTSKYRNLIDVKSVDFKETLDDTVRLAYVGLFHKLENYINDIVKIPELIFGEIYETEGTVLDWAKKKYNFEIKDWQQFYITHKINWICNCVKHKDGYPIKLPKPIDFLEADEGQRIKVSPQDFKLDCESLIKFYPIYINALFMFSKDKLFSEMKLKTEDQKLIETNKDLADGFEEFNITMRKFMDNLKKMG